MPSIFRTKTAHTGSRHHPKEADFIIAFVDPDLCIGCTQCAGLCPAVFHMEGVLAVAEPGPIPPEEVPQAVDAANACPVSAIRMEA